MTSSLRGKVCFLTGAGSGIGEATTSMLLAGGARVFALGRTPEKLDALKAKHPGQPLEAYPADVTKEDAVAAAFAACRDRFGPTDILINNAGIGLPTPDLATADAATFDKMANTNFKGVFLCCREALQDMKPRKSGAILTVISMGGQRSNAIAPLYCASKFAARGFSSGLADQVLKDGIKITDINPGPVDTPYWGERAVPRDKFLKPEDVAGVIRFILTLPDHVVVREINFDNIHWLAK